MSGSKSGFMRQRNGRHGMHAESGFRMAGMSTIGAGNDAKLPYAWTPWQAKRDTIETDVMPNDASPDSSSFPATDLGIEQQPEVVFPPAPTCDGAGTGRRNRIDRSQQHCVRHCSALTQPHPCPAHGNSASSTICGMGTGMPAAEKANRQASAQLMNLCIPPRFMSAV